jgi:hypothetical protein
MNQSKLSSLYIQACVLTLAVSLFTACGSGSTKPRARSVVIPLTVSYRPVPRLEVPHYHTRGVYPQVVLTGSNLRAVNESIKRTVIDDQSQYARDARSMESSVRTPHGWYGTYQLFIPGPNRSNESLDKNLISASSVVVSALIPTFKLFPGGNNGQGFVSVTAVVPSGRIVHISDVFASPHTGLKALAVAFRKRVLRTNSCVRETLKSPVVGPTEARGFEPTASNYRYFALTTKGLAIGFPLGQVGPGACNTVEATVSYSTIEPYLSDLGRKLIAGVRLPA